MPAPRILAYQKVPFQHNEKNIKLMKEIFQPGNGITMKVMKQKKMQDFAKN